MPFGCSGLLTLITLTFWLFGAQIPAWLARFNGLPDGTRELLLAMVSLGLAALWWLARRTWSTFVRSPSRYEQWTKLANQFLDIATRDNAEILPTNKKKVSVEVYDGMYRFVDGSQPHHATETESLSRLAGRLLRHSRVKHRSHWFDSDPIGRWVDFVVQSIKVIEPHTAENNVIELQSESAASGIAADAAGSFFRFDVFPFASYLVCRHCASFERLPRA